MKLPGITLFFFTCCFLVCIAPAKAQFGDESPVPYFRYALSFGGGPAMISGDLQGKALGAGIFLRGDYFLRHGISISLEAQEGALRSGDQYDNIDSYPVTLLFFTGLLNVRFHPLMYMQDDHDRRIMYRKTYLQKAINTVYLGAGFGGMFNFTRSEAVRTYTNGSFFGYIYHTDIGVDLPLNRMAPYLMDSFMWYINVNGQLNFAADKGMDGFGEQRDSYGMFSVGIKLKL
ncbi:hypothetical protein [Parapedobacter koreensis]|uniref:Outer membrane protein beta-barrel domain-containing protein n=1 Tax=Parapedobacter koreensis TaxID=332977 RepID=A0A1H7JXT4_9SPHI|nr:hypothetical protein [Parapedobacter koreensis]SEK79194.1 hypothetical protein SAMN05421740_102706 [Parapedobacter koreensis]